MIPDLAALEALEAVVDGGSIGAASARLNKAPSAISYHLRRLEEQIGEALIDRSGYRLALTPQGETFLAEARPVLQGLRKLGSLSARKATGWELALRIVFDGALPMNGIIRALLELEARKAPTRVELTVSFLTGVELEFDNRDADLLISAAPITRRDLAVIPLAPLGFTLCCAAHHPLAAMNPVSLDDLRAANELIIPSPGTDPAYFSRHFDSHKVFCLSDFHTKLTAIAEGLGYGWLPNYLAQPYLAEGALHHIRYVNGNCYQLSPFCATRTGQSPGNACQAILQHLKNERWDWSTIRNANA